MIWIVSSSVAGTEENLSARHEYIELVSQARVSPWQKRTAVTASKRYLNYYQCKSEKGEYGLFITAHIDEAFSILRATQNNKKTLFSINACQVSNMHKRKLLNAVKKRNPQSELYLARQEKRKDGKIVNYKEKKRNKYLTSLLVETSLLAKAIRKTNNTKTAKGLYTKITSSIIEMIVAYLDIPKDNFAVHIYAYDGSTKFVRRVDVESFVKTMQAADENLPQSIDDPEISKRFYAKSIKSKRTYFMLPTLDEIRKNLYFPVNDDVIISQHTQYVAMIYDVGSRVKLYIEVISYNGLHFGEDANDLEEFAKKVIAPFSSLLSLVDWNTIRSDCNAN